jgi:hypothetical protein
LDQLDLFGGPTQIVGPGRTPAPTGEPPMPSQASSAAVWMKEWLLDIIMEPELPIDTNRLRFAKLLGTRGMDVVAYL